MKGLLRLALSVWFALSASESGAYYQSRDCKVTTTGADWLYEYTNIWAILTDSGGNSSSSPSHLLVRNGDSKPCSVKVTASPVYSHPDDPVLLERIVIQNAGDTLEEWHGYYRVEPGGTAIIPLSMYSRRDRPVTAILANFVYWVADKKPSPSPTPTPAPSAAQPRPAGGRSPAQDNGLSGISGAGWLITHDDPSDDLRYGMKEWYYFSPGGSLIVARLGENGWYDARAGDSSRWREVEGKIFISKSGGEEWRVFLEGERLHFVAPSGEETSYPAARLDDSPLR